MTSSSVRRGLIAALIATAALSACECGDKTQVAGCSTDQECKDQNHSDRWICDKTQNPGLCTELPRQCDTASDCCPAQICNQSGRFCSDKFTPCTGPGSCTALGQVCKTIGVFPSGLGCTFAKCGAGDSCADGTTCFNKYCVGEPPCPSLCPGKVCTTATNLCSTAPADVSCQRSCPKGQLLVLTNPDNIFDSCQPAANTCECASLPPLAIHDLGRHSGATVAGNNLYVSTYDGEYGDLVLLTYDKASLAKPIKSEWLDGVPPTGHIGGDLRGPRGGITDVGQNVGQYTSIAADGAGNLFISYYDVDNGDLKFIGRYNGTWTQPMTIDGSTAGGTPTGDVGLYSSLALTSQGVPAVAYFRRGNYDATAKAETGISTALVYAIAKTAQPQTRGDWIVLGDVEQANKPTPPCGAGCPTGQLCVDEGSGQSRCARPAASTAPCTNPSCAGTQACVQSADGLSSVCKSSLAAQTLIDLPQGVGVTPSLAFLDDKAVIAYYDSVNKTLKAVQADKVGEKPISPVIIDGVDAVPARKRDVGRFPSLAIGKSGQTGGRIAIAFPDLTSQVLLLYQADSLRSDGAKSGLIHIIDNGRPNQDDAKEAWHPQSFPGSQTSIAFTASGKIVFAYQDATPVDLRFATWDPAQKSSQRVTLRGQGAAGFWPKVVIDGNTAIVTSATIKAATALVSGNKLVVDTRPAP